MRQRPHRDPFYPGLRDRPERLQVDAAAGLELARPPTCATAARSCRCPCCRAAAAARRPRAPPRSPPGCAPRPPAAPPSAGAAARARSTAAAMPPAAAMWFSLIRIASYSPARWLTAPPAATAAFSSARSPGVVLRVSSTRARPCPPPRAPRAPPSSPRPTGARGSSAPCARRSAAPPPSPRSPSPLRPARATRPPRRAA